MSRPKRAIVSLLCGIVRQNRLGNGNGRLRGGLTERTRVVEACNNYRAQLAGEDEKSFDRTYGCRVNPMLRDLRQTAGDRKLSADARLKAIERLLRISGFSFAPLYDEPLDRRIAELLRASALKVEPVPVAPVQPLPEVEDFNLEEL